MRPSTETDALTVLERDEMADALTLYTCLRNCYGERNMAGSCCTVTNRDYIIGPIPDPDALLERLSEKYGRAVPWDEVFIGSEEGSDLFPEKPVWQNPKCYPALRVNIDDEARPCRFLGKDNLCTIHDIRSVTCAKFFCGHLKGIMDSL